MNIDEIKPKERCLIIDGNNILYRCHYASKYLPWESDTKAVFIFLRVMVSLLKENTYQKLLVTFDSTKTNFRHQIYPNYKINRLLTPNEFLKQLDILQNLITQTGVVLVKMENFEADDLIASFVSQNSNSKITFDILSQDKDLLQLLTPEVNVCKYSKKKIITFRYSDFLEIYGFLPINYVDYLSLLGDKVDNIEGIEGIGEKKAQRLIKRFGSIENIYANLDSLSEDLQKILAEKKAVIDQNKELISLKSDLNLLVTWESCSFSWEKWRTNKILREFCRNHQFKSISESLNK